MVAYQGARYPSDAATLAVDEQETNKISVPKY